MDADSKTGGVADTAFGAGNSGSVTTANGSKLSNGFKNASRHIHALAFAGMDGMSRKIPQSAKKSAPL
jgi:hypothetical protein